MHKILVITLYFLLDALHVSDYISPKHVEHLIENKVLSQEFCASCWFIYIQSPHFLEYSMRSLPKIDRLLYRSMFNRVAFVTKNLHFQKYLTHK